MYALSKSRNSAFIFDPTKGLEIPLVAEFSLKAIFVEYPDVHDLEADFEFFDSLDELREHAQGHKQDIDAIVKTNQAYSRKLHDVLEDGEASLSEISDRIVAWEKEKTKAVKKPVAASTSYRKLAVYDSDAFQDQRAIA